MPRTDTRHQPYAHYHAASDRQKYQRAANCRTVHKARAQTRDKSRQTTQRVPRNPLRVCKQRRRPTESSRGGDLDLLIIEISFSSPARRLPRWIEWYVFHHVTLNPLVCAYLLLRRFATSEDNPLPRFVIARSHCDSVL